jgi:hypothetical protein
LRKQFVFSDLTSGEFGLSVAITPTEGFHILTAESSSGGRMLGVVAPQL